MLEGSAPFHPLRYNANPAMNDKTTSDSSMTMTLADPNALEMVRDFHRLFRCPVLAAPAIPAPDRCALRVNLLREEVRELADAIRAGLSTKNIFKVT